MITSEDRRRATDDAEPCQTRNTSSATDATEDDGTPVLDEVDLEENHLTVEEADAIEWEEPKQEERSR